MNVISVIKERRSIRKYMDRLVEDEKLQNILEAARLAPSADNNQGWKFIVIKDNETRKKLVETTGQTWVALAPIIIVCCGMNPTIIMPNGQPKYTVDLSVATSFMMLEAVNQGLGTCWLGGYDESAVRGILGIPDKVRVVSMLSLGYPDETPAPRPRKELYKIVSYEKY